MPSKSNSLFSGAGILIFNKHESITTDHVWFCKMKTNKEGKRNEQSLHNEAKNDLLYSSRLKWCTWYFKPMEKPESDREINDPGNSFI